MELIFRIMTKDILKKNPDFYIEYEDGFFAEAPEAKVYDGSAIDMVAFNTLRQYCKQNKAEFLDLYNLNFLRKKKINHP